jgi:Flp pilus assembly secretin CpaC
MSQTSFGHDIQRVAVGDGDLIDVSVVGARVLRIKGVHVGKTTLLVWLKDGQRESKVIEVR